MREAFEGFDGRKFFGGKNITNLRYAHEITIICASRGGGGVDEFTAACQAGK